MEDSLKKAIEQMKNGEEKGFNEVYSATYNRVYFRARQIMKKEEDAHVSLLHTLWHILKRFTIQQNRPLKRMKKDWLHFPKRIFLP